MPGRLECSDRLQVAINTNDIGPRSEIKKYKLAAPTVNSSFGTDERLTRGAKQTGRHRSIALRDNVLIPEPAFPIDSGGGGG